MIYCVLCRQNERVQSINYSSTFCDFTFLTLILKQMGLINTNLIKCCMHTYFTSVENMKMKNFNLSAFYSQKCKIAGKSVTSGTVNYPFCTHTFLYIG